MHNRRTFLKFAGLSGVVLPVAGIAFYSRDLISRAFASSTLSPPPGRYSTSWIGNSFSGNIPPDNNFPSWSKASRYYGFGKWVQDEIISMDVTNNGTVLTASLWDEAGRMTGLYKDNDVNEYPLRTGSPVATTTDSWGTAGASVAVIGDLIFIASIEGYVIKFQWSDPQNIQASIAYQGYVKLATPTPAEQTAPSPVQSPPDMLSVMSGRAETLAVAFEGRDVHILNPRDMSLRKALSLSNITGIAIDSKNTLWVIQNGKILHYGMDGQALPGQINDVAKATAISIDENDVLLICDDGPNQQVLSYTLSANPQLIQRYGLQGGLGSGTPGEMAPNKFFALRGAGLDKDGNLYVSMCFGPSPNSPVVIRSLTPQQQLRWEVSKYCWVTVCCFDPLSDGTVIYGPQSIFSYDPEAEPGQGWKAEAITLDPIKYPNDPRITDMRGQANTQACSTELRHLQGKRLMYTLPQMGGQYGLYAFEDAPSQIAYYVGSIGTSSAGGNSGGDNFAFHVDAKGGVWQGQTSNNKIWHYAFAGWSDAGIPIFASPVKYSVPDLFTELTRAHYECSSDSLYIGGYTAKEVKKNWGEVGAVMSRYDHWTSGNPQLRWAVTLPLDDRGYPPKSFTIAGDYLFTVHIYPVQGMDTVVTILDIDNGATVGTLLPGAVVGNICGWVDTLHGIQAMRRKNGQYLVIVEGDARGKNIVYQWAPV